MFNLLCSNISDYHHTIFALNTITSSAINKYNEIRNCRIPSSRVYSRTQYTQFVKKRLAGEGSVSNK